MTTYVLLGGAALAAFFILPKFLGKR